MLVIFLILSFLALFFPKEVSAQNNINKFGIHILEPTDLPRAQELVNSSGGDWGWVTVVIRDDDMNFDKWQGFMDECRERHLIPIVRIASHLEGENWAKPKVDDANSWVNFLDSLNWPVSNQYVIIFNEPNHAKEWGGEVNPQEYAKILNEFIQKFQISNFKFQILNAGLDSAAPNTKTTMDSYQFMKLMNQEIPGIFDQIDGWASHSYPNHGYLGKPWETGKHSIQGYGQELAVLKNDFGLQKNLPVFITETGWPKNNSEPKTKNLKKYYSEKVVAEYTKDSFENVWLKDERVMAVTPFVLSYPGALFFDFSWIDKEDNPYSSFEEIKKILKIQGRPNQEFKAEILSFALPPFLPVETEFNGQITLKNTGQSIWGEYSKIISSAISDTQIAVPDLVIPEGVKVAPGEKISLDYSLKSSSTSGTFIFGWNNLKYFEIKVLPSSVITTAKYNFWQKVILKIKSVFIRA